MMAKLVKVKKKEELPEICCICGDKVAKCESAISDENGKCVYKDIYVFCMSCGWRSESIEIGVQPPPEVLFVVRENAESMDVNINNKKFIIQVN